MLQSSFSNLDFECGLDEVGRGCLAGPVVAGAVIFPKNYTHSELTDSKKISKKKRIRLVEDIKRDALAWVVAEVSPLEIDQINILQASFKAMHLCVDKLKITPEFLLVDGNRFVPYKKIPFECIVKGDSKYLSIAGASILAKTFRDDLMEAYAEKFPEYAWEKNAGYPTKVHRAAIKEHGVTKLHRLSFKLLPDELV